MRAYARQYNYDKIGNVQQVTQSGTNGFTRNFVYHPNFNALKKIETGSSTLIQDFSYDSVGNQITAGTTRNYVWNAGNQLITYYNQAGMADPTIFAQYDYSGMNRVSKMVRTGTAGSPIYERTIYIDGIFEYHILENGTTYEKNYVHIMDDQSRIAMVRIGTAFPADITDAITFNLEDQIGSSTARLNTVGGVIDREEYYPFGDSSLRTFTKKRYRFTGKERDSESGLYYYGARYYSPWTCRFVSVDQLSAKHPGISAYAYAFNNPIMFNDPTGMEGKPVSEGPTDNLVINDYLSVAKETAISIGSDKVKFGISPKTGTLFTDDGSGLVQNVEGATVIGYRTPIEEQFDWSPSQEYDNEKQRAFESALFYAEQERMRKANWYANSSGAVSSAGFFDPAYDIAESGVSNGLQSVGLDESTASSTAGGIIFFGSLATGKTRFQKHHIIPNQAYKTFKSDLKAMGWKQSDMLNLKKLPTGFHGNHPAYNNHIMNEMNLLKQSGNLNLNSMRNLQQNTRLMIGDAYRSGEKLNDYFK